MPNFHIFSRLDKQLIKLLLIKATTIDESDIFMHELMYFRPESFHDPDEDKKE